MPKFGFPGLCLLIGIVTFAIQQGCSVTGAASSWAWGAFWFGFAILLVLLAIWFWDQTAAHHWVRKSFASLIVILGMGALSYMQVAKQFHAEERQYFPWIIAEPTVTMGGRVRATTLKVTVHEYPSDPGPRLESLYNLHIALERPFTVFPFDKASPGWRGWASCQVADRTISELNYESSPELVAVDFVTDVLVLHFSASARNGYWQGELVLNRGKVRDEWISGFSKDLPSSNTVRLLVHNGSGWTGGSASKREYRRWFDGEWLRLVRSGLPIKDVTQQGDGRKVCNAAPVYHEQFGVR